MFRALPDTAEIDEDGNCRSCGAPTGSYHRYGIRILVALLIVPAWFALSDRLEYWSIEYLPHLHGTFFATLVLGSLVAVVLSGLLFHWGGQKETALWILAAVIPLILLGRLSVLGNDPDRIAGMVERLEQETTLIQRQAEDSAVIPDALKRWSDAQVAARAVLDDARDTLGSTRVAVYAYAIDAATSGMTGTGNQADDWDMNRRFERTVGENRVPFEIGDFVACYRKADRKGVSHRGVLKTGEFLSCFEAFGRKP